MTGYNVFRGTVSGGPYTVLVNSTPLAPGTTSFQDTSVLPGNNYYYVVQATSGPLFSPLSNEAATATPAASANLEVDLTEVFNVVGITAKGAKFTYGADGIGNALSGAELGTSLTVGGTDFSIGPAGTLNMLAATGQTLALPSGQYSQLRFLAIGVNGNQINQTFTVAYTDGTVATLTQSLSDWYTPQNYAGETLAVSTAYRNTAAGTTDNRTFDVYSYTINLDSSKTVSSLRLPDDEDVRLLAVSMVAPVAAPAGLTASTAAQNVVNLSWSAPGTAPGGYNVYRGTSSGGESDIPLNSSPLPGNATSYQDTTAIAGNTYYYVVQAVNGSATSPSSNEVAAALPASGTSTAVDLASAFNLTGITANGAKFTGGLDGVGNALSAASLGSSVSLGGVTFDFGPAGSSDVVQAAGQTIALPAGQFSQLEFLATGVNGDQVNQAFTVHYTDGSSATVTQSISDWYTPQHFSGESLAVATPYRNMSGGGTDNRTFDVYSYSIALDNSKTVSSITLPNNGHVEVLAVSVVQ